MAQIHHVRGWEVGINPHATIPTAPHVQPQSAWLFKLHFSCKGSWEAKMITQRSVQRYDELSRLIPDMAFHWGELPVGAQPRRRPALLFLEHHSDLGLAPSILLSWPAPPLLDPE